MPSVFGLLTLVFAIAGTQALIVPQELPSILSLVYSNIPPIKKGSDNRVGFGFRLGEHADFQVLLELGPQTQTRKIGGVAATKRQVSNKDYIKPSTNKSSNPESSSWLNNWSNDMTLSQKKRKKVLHNTKKLATSASTSTSTTTTTVRTVPLISEDAMKLLQQLYKLNTNLSTERTSTTPSQSLESTTKSPEEQKKITDQLMDVDLE